MAQIMHAILLASAMATSIFGLRACSRSSHVPHEHHELRARQLLAKLDLTRHRRPVRLENILCQIHPDHCIFHRSVLSALWFSDQHPDTLRCRLARAATTPSLYSVRKIWHVLRREGEDVARCTVERLMRALSIKGVIRGKKVITTNPDTSLPCPDDKVNHLFKANRPNKLWVSDFTYMPTWPGTVYVAFMIDVFARRIVGWRTSTSMKTQFVLDALDQAIWQRKTPDNKASVHHSDRG